MQINKRRKYNLNNVAIYFNEEDFTFIISKCREYLNEKKINYEQFSMFLDIKASTVGRVMANNMMKSNLATINNVINFSFYNGLIDYELFKKNKKIINGILKDRELPQEELNQKEEKYYIFNPDVVVRKRKYVHRSTDVLDEINKMYERNSKRLSDVRNSNRLIIIDNEIKASIECSIYKEYDKFFRMKADKYFFCINKQSIIDGTVLYKVME